jgi:hypothetical protein
MRSVRPSAAASAAALTALLIGGATGAATAAPGTNGTVKVAPHGDIDAIPDNTPHVGCTFQLEWYGFDAGVTSTVSFTEQAPTTGVGLAVDGPGTVTLDDDPGNGAGNDGFDGSAVYTLSFTGAPHPQQGYHVDLTINTPESNGSDVKHKVFWVEGCAPAAPPTTPASPEATPATPPATPEATPAATPEATPATPSATTPSTPSATPDADEDKGGPEVLGEQASTGPENGPKPSVQGQQAGRGHTGGVRVAGRQQAVPTVVNAGAEASPMEQGPVAPAALATLGALLGLGAVAARRRRA